MIMYLKDGWYTRLGQRRLRTEVVDGAIDTASMLFRSAVPPEVITNLALKIRTLATIADPPHRRGSGGFGTQERAALAQRLQIYTDRYPALQSFVSDCMEHVRDAMELRALYLHLVHVTQMMQLLMVAKLSGAAGGLGLLGGPVTRPPASSGTVASLADPGSVPSTSHQVLKKPAGKKKAVAATKAPAKKKAAKPARKAARKAAGKKAKGRK